MTIMSTQHTCRDYKPCLENSTSNGRYVTKPLKMAGKVKLSITPSLSRTSTSATGHTYREIMPTNDSMEYDGIPSWKFSHNNLYFSYAYAH